ncbi:unnamed protein product [Strongylus vulgaris]|uniref:PITH domain-containing protein n=1 Tax=Strongylus vulgaris TaxID=40348 RepID=A0A3P7JT30_STRVU|nr:unnamed protein product [Strongylus vulgaris]
MVQKWADTQPSGDVPGQSDITCLIDKRQMECLNGDDSTPLAGLLEGISELSHGLEAMVQKWADTQPSGDTIPLRWLDYLKASSNYLTFNVFEISYLGENVLRSDCDEQLIISLPFTQPVKVHSIMLKVRVLRLDVPLVRTGLFLLKGNEEKTPRLVRVFSNLPNTLDFDGATSVEAVQVLEFSEKAQTGERHLFGFTHH